MFTPETFGLLKGARDGIEQILIPKRFGKEVDRARFHRVGTGRNIPVSRDKDDRLVATGRR
jgi:hypothetical protein